MARRLHFWALVALLVWAPLPLGSNRPWSWTLLAVAAGFLAAAWPLVAARAGDVPWLSPRRIAGPGVLFAGVMLWAALQASTLLPIGIAHPIWADARGALPTGLVSAARVAVAPDAAVTGILRLLCYAAVFWLALQHGRSGNRARLLVGALALASGVYALYGLAAHFSGSDSILWFRKWAYDDYLTSTFVNPNSYAAYAGLGLIAALAAIIARLERRHGPGISGDAFEKVGFLLAAAVAGVLALLATGSRAGITATGIGVAVLVAGVWTIRSRPERRWRVASLLAGALLAGFACVAAVLMYAGVGSEDVADRLRVYRITVDLIAARPWTGYGLGAFPTVFASARPETVSQVWTQAHNSYLELALDLGVPAAATLFAAVLWLIVRCGRGAMIRRRERLFPVLGLAASALIASHSLLDFSAQIPAVAVTWMALLGVAVAQSWQSGAAPAVSAGRESVPRTAPAPRSAAP